MTYEHAKTPLDVKELDEGVKEFADLLDETDANEKPQIKLPEPTQALETTDVNEIEETTENSNEAEENRAVETPTAEVEQTEAVQEEEVDIWDTNIEIPEEEGYLSVRNLEAERTLVMRQIAAHFEDEGKLNYQKFAEDLVKLSQKFVCVLEGRGNVLYIWDEATKLYTNELNEVYALGKSLCKRKWTSYAEKEVVYNLKKMFTKRRNEVELPRNIIPLLNGNFSTDTYELTQRTHELFITEHDCMNVTFDPLAECPNWMRFLDSLELPQQSIDTLQEAFGTCLQRDVRYKKSYTIYGPPDTGKSVIGNVLLKMFNDLAESIAFDQLCESKFWVSHLDGKLVNVSSEKEVSKIEALELYKRLTGNEESMSVEDKHEKGRKTRLFAKLFTILNKLFIVSEDEAFYARQILLHFHKQFPTGSADRIENLLEILTTPEELSGIFNWSVEGLKRLTEKRVFSINKNAKENRDEWKMDSVDLWQYLSSSLVEWRKNRSVDDNSVYEYDKDMLTRDFAMWARENMRPALTKHALGKAMSQHIQEIRTGKRVVIDEYGVANTYRHWKGIRRANDPWFDEIEEDDEDEEDDEELDSSDDESEEVV